MKFFFSYSITEARKHKCNTCLILCSVFIVVVTVALCSVLIDNAAVVFFREAEQQYGEYDTLIQPKYAPFLNYSLISNVLNQNSIHYHSPRLSYNTTKKFLYSTKCFNQSLSPYNSDICSSKLNNNSKCNHISSFPFWLIDFEKEERMQFGRNFHSDNIPNKNEIIIFDEIAIHLNVSVGDIIYLILPINDNSVPLLANYIQYQFDMSVIEMQNILNQCNDNIIPVTVSMISSDFSLGGKFAKTKREWSVAMDMKYFLQLFIDSLPPRILDELNSQKYKHLQLTSYDFINLIYVNLNDRVDSYLSTNYQTIQKNLIQFASKVSYYLGWNQIDLRLDLLSFMKSNSNTMLSLGVILDVIMFVLILLCIVLLYSLLVISIETKTYTFGIFRMLGMSRNKLITFLEFQSFTYAFPAWIIGLIVAQIIIIYILQLLTSNSNINLNIWLTPMSIIIATIIGICMTLIASILPIKSVLSKTLQSSLDINHSKTNAIQFNISRSDNNNSINCNLFSISFVMALFGYIIYYFFPKSLISGNLQLFAIMLMLLMLSILIGCVLLVLNIQHLCEKFVLFVTLSWWENNAIVQIISKNLIAHKIRNRKTSLMYSFSLSFIFFITVTVYTQLSLLKMNSIASYGAKLYCYTYPNITVNEYIENILNNIDYIEDYSWKYESILKNNSQMSLSNIGKIFSHPINLIPTSPNFDSVIDKHFIVPVDNNYYDYKSIYTMRDTQQLFTAYGSQRALISEFLSDIIHIKSINDIVLLNIYNNNNEINYKKFMTLRLYKLFPSYTFRHYMKSDLPSVVISMSTIPRLFSNDIESVEDLRIIGLLIKFKSTIINSQIDETKIILNDLCNSCFDYRNMEKTLLETSNTLDIIFSFITYMTLCLCLFSLISSMIVNIMEQSKQIGVLRSIGLTKYQINKIYIYEAFVVILSSSLLGFIVGYILSFVIVQQQILFTEYPLRLIIPMSVIFSVVTGAILTSVVSVYFPLKSLNKKQISQNLRDLSL